jgi:hypothetical protein
MILVFGSKYPRKPVFLFAIFAEFARSNLFSDDFYQILTRIPKMSLRGLYTMIKWSIKFSMATPEEKILWESALEKQWKEFCAEITSKKAEYLA